MAAQDNEHLSDPIPFDAMEPLAPPAKGPPAGAPVSGGSASKFQTFGGGSVGLGQTKFKRPVNKTGKGASRVRTFHAKLNDGAMAFLDQQINEWLDENPDFEAKFGTTTVGTIDAKRGPEQHLIITVWY
jgi:hypothetical protein